jgi:alpha-L-fucosidase
MTHQPVLRHARASLAAVAVAVVLGACRATVPPPPGPAPAPPAAVAPALPMPERPEMAWWRQSMETRADRVSWFRDARFGMFVHWGLYSLPGGVWNGKAIEGYAEHLMRKERLSVAAYRTELAAKWNPTGFDADAWVGALKRAGMGYLLITSKHHDGFAMYDSAVSDFNVVKATPWKRDPMRELRDACQRQGIRFGFYYSHARDWTDGPVEDWDRTRAKPADAAAFARHYVDTKAIPQVRELIAKYDPDILWFDTPEKLPVEENLRVLRAAREAKPSLVVNGRAVQVTPEGPPARYGDYVSSTDKPAEFPPIDGDWEAIPTTNESYGWHQKDDSHKPPAHFIRLLAKAAARGGNVLLNIGPMGDGKMDPKDLAILDGVGAWMKVNGDAIHGTTRTPLPVQAWGESTRKGTTLYLHVFDWPRGGRITVGGLRTDVERAYLLGDAGRAPLAIERAGELDVVVRGPAQAPDAVDTVIALELAGAPVADPARLLSADVHLDTLRAFDGKLAGGLTFAKGKQETAYVEGWRTTDATVSWPVRVSERATYDVAVAYDADKKSSGGAFTVKVGDKLLEGKVVPTPKVPVRIGSVTLEPGRYEVTFTGTKIEGGELLRLRGLTFAFVQRGPGGEGLAQTWPYRGCDMKALPYSYPDDPAHGFPPGSCPPPASLPSACPSGSKLKIVDAIASTFEKGFMHPPSYAIDDHLDSRWSSHYTDDQWLELDLGRVQRWKRIALVWELAYGSRYAILTSNDHKTWTTLHTETGSDGFIDVIDAEGKGRYIKIQGLARGNVGNDPLYGYSLFDVSVCKESSKR